MEKSLFLVLTITSLIFLVGCSSFLYSTSEPNLYSEGPLVFADPVSYETEFFIEGDYDYYFVMSDVTGLSYNLYLNNELLISDSGFHGIGAHPVAKELLLEPNILRLEFDTSELNENTFFDFSFEVDNEEDFFTPPINRTDHILARLNSKELIN